MHAPPSRAARDRRTAQLAATNGSVGCYWPHHKGVFDLGIDGWWPDQGDGLDAPSRLNRIRMYWEGSQLWRPNERPFALHRNGYAGMARYGAFLWSGDVYSTWETLKTHVPVAINTGLAAFRIWGTDIGGFVPTPEFTGELYVRWFQFGAFCPLFRAHGRTWHLRLPWGWNTGELGPNETSSLSRRRQSARVRAAQRAGRADLPEVSRAALPADAVPVLRACARRSQTGLPIMRALWLHYPDDPDAVARGDSISWGRDILVAPVVGEGRDRRAASTCRAARGSISGPNERVDGGREIDRAVDLETMPLYVRAGANRSDGAGEAVHGRAVRRSADDRRVSRRRRRVRALRGRRPIVRLPARRLDGIGDALVGADGPPVCLARPRLAHGAANTSRAAGSPGRKYRDPDDSVRWTTAVGDATRLSHAFTCTYVL